MTNENAGSGINENPEPDVMPQGPQPTFRWLPWALAGGAALLYLLTMNHWVTVLSLPIVSRVTGWDWHPANLDFRPAILPPLYSLLTAPVRLFPMGARPVVMNVISVVFGVGVLWELARSVKLLPQDRTREQRLRWQNDYGVLVGSLCWIPACFAVVLLALQMTFWQNSTQATGEMLDLWIFAFCFRALMEYRVTAQDNWLLAAGFACGLGIVNNWVMIAYSPFFLAALVWVKGIEAFNLKFLIKLVAVGLAGLALYLLVPLCDTLYGGGEQGYWLSLKTYLRYQKSFLVDLPFVRDPKVRAELFLILLTSLFPLIMCCIRWGRLGGDFNPAGSAVTKMMFRLVHIFFLAVAAWVFFDPPFSAREISQKSMPFLTCYYMTALVAGYLMGYVVLIFGIEPSRSWERSTGVGRLIDKAMVCLAIVSVVALPVLLVVKNLPAIRAQNSELLANYASLMVDQLPESHSIVMSEDPYQIMLLQAAYQKEGKTHDNLLVETRCLRQPRYLTHLHDTHPEYGKLLGKPNLLPPGAIPEAIMLLYLTNLANGNRVFYLHPSFGYFFEAFYARPHGILYELKRYPGVGGLLPPPLTTPEVDENENFWYARQEKMIPQVIQEDKAGSPDAKIVSLVLSSALDYWGVELQRLPGNKGLKKAGERFLTAQTLNPDNAVADINLRFNTALQNHSVRAVEKTKEIQRNLGKFPSVEAAMAADGPFDEIEYDYKLGEAYAENHNLRQAMQMFYRAIDLRPDWPEARIALAKTYIDLRMPEQAVAAIKPLHDIHAKTPLSLTNEVELIRVESFARAQAGQYAEGEKLITDALKKQKNDRNMLGVLSQFYILTKRTNDAIGAINQMLGVDPENIWALFNKGKLLFEQQKYDQVIDTFNKFMSFQTASFEPLLYRAISYLQTGQLDKAKEDYRKLESMSPEPLYFVYYGLGEIAYREKDTSTARKYYDLYLKHGPSQLKSTAEYKTIKSRYEELTSGK